MVELTLGGKTYELRFSLKSVRVLETHYKKPLSKIFKDKESSESMETLIVFYYACMKPKAKSLTFDKVEDLLDEALDKGEIEFTDLAAKMDEVIEGSTLLKGYAQEGDSKN